MFSPAFQESLARTILENPATPYAAMIGFILYTFRDHIQMLLRIVYDVAGLLGGAATVVKEIKGDSEQFFDEVGRAIASPFEGLTGTSAEDWFR